MHDTVEGIRTSENHPKKQVILVEQILNANSGVRLGQRLVAIVALAAPLAVHATDWDATLASQTIQRSCEGNQAENSASTATATSTDACLASV